MSQGLLLAYYAMDNGCNVCGLEFDYNNNNSNSSKEEEEDVEDNEENLNRDDVADVDKFYNNQILGDLFLGFEVKSEDGRSGFLVLDIFFAIRVLILFHRWVHPEFKDEGTNGGGLESKASMEEVVVKMYNNKEVVAKLDDNKENAKNLVNKEGLQVETWKCGNVEMEMWRGRAK